MFKKDFITKNFNKNKKINIEKFINECLYGKNGYYKKSAIIGKKGDFITSPEISQLFGEILGIYIVSYWNRKINKPFNLVELGPGRGTLIKDILNVSKSIINFTKSTELYLIETNSTLAKIQKKNILPLSIFHKKIKWKKSFNISNSKPTIVFCNEFFDCFPIRQFYFKDKYWYEKKISYNSSTKKLLYNNAKIIQKKTLRLINSYKAKSILEISKSREIYFNKICSHISKQSGMAIIFDYGYLKKPNNFTLQAVYNNRKSNVLENIYNQDLTSFVDFDKLINIAKKFNLKIDCFSNQRDFLINNGIRLRAKKILEKAAEKQKKDIECGLERIIDIKNMGTLFKVLIFSK